MTIMLNGSDLTVTQVVAVARHGEAVTLAPAAIAAMRQWFSPQRLDLPQPPDSMPPCRAIGGC